MLRASRLLLALATAGLILAASALPVTARDACPNGGFQSAQLLNADGSLNMAVVDDYPSILRAFADQIYSPDVFAADVAALDKNGNGVLCIKDIWEHNGGHGGPPEPDQAQGLGGFFYFVHGIDDKL
ncbi:MAG TPA: hypothetical protein VHH53_00075 [Pseudonocardiaceae bacterium]|nr:hypothetical protein [Pseudonocardiaceae bacterium]